MNCTARLTFALPIAIAMAFPLAASPPPPQGLNAGQLIRTSETPSVLPLGEQGAVDGDSAVVLAGTDVPENASSPRDVIFFERDATGTWAMSQRIAVATILNGFGGRSVAISGDLAAVFARSVSPLPFQTRSRIYLFERDALGVWSQTQSFTADYPGSELGAVEAIEFAGEDLVVTETVVSGARILRRTAGAGSWAEVQSLSLGPIAPVGVEVATADNLAVLTTRSRDAQVHERDAMGVWNSTGFVPHGGRPFGRASATDGERVAVTRIHQQTALVESIEIYRRPAPGTGSEWVLEESLAYPFISTLGLVNGTYSSAYSSLFLENDTLILSAYRGCRSDYQGALVTFRRDSNTSSWFLDDPICTGPVLSVLLDFDGDTALTGLSSLPGLATNDPDGAIGFAPIVTANVDCDLDGVLDAAQIAACPECDLNANQRLDRCEPVGYSSCALDTPNSSGRIARLQAFGPGVAGGDDIAFTAVDTSTQTLGLLASGRRFTNQPVATGNGFRCVRGPDLGRWVSQAANTGPNGTFSVVADLGAVPTSMGTTTVLAGETWVFQAWFRDGASSNFTDAIAIGFR